MTDARNPPYRADLARIHDLEFGFHARDCAPGIIDLLSPVLDRDGLVVELGCGSGALTRYLVAAGFRVVATDASPAMLDRTREAVPNALAVHRLTLPDDPIPTADAIVSTGHALNYLADGAAIDRALVAMAGSLRPHGVMAIDVCDHEYAAARGGLQPHFRQGEDWVLMTRFEAPAPDLFDRHMTTFTRDGEMWRRDDEVHRTVLVNTALIPGLLAEHGVVAEVRSGFGSEVLPSGLMAVLGTKRI